MSLFDLGGGFRGRNRLEVADLFAGDRAVGRHVAAGVEFLGDTQLLEQRCCFLGDVDLLRCNVHGLTPVFLS
ncbi:hypothetical protein D9M72_503390 [compost metagenome]